ncbi:3-oxoacyl-[acyl-carrier-protein] synthase III [Carnobacterium iners]|uniref:Beta-ketoacyl-[acyl-carrier-protein] synthase III n=1 Tax=Carnobacterium iners TaxID=1073423 RepID=A0A1X7NI27_9LACT|nr:beta-ketoacyl-ACP synthase III [Carnobacterium iners]SEK65030.1 3-oxoacyl-[acyl-carrier-protein] synthase III [Carnobacterium iners]SMH37469.1 3-oxoacyl-[acyl-carrier-protein] synthase III [Carnobacterium iners]
MQAKIISTGSYVPKKIVSNKDLEAIMDTSDEWIKTRTGIENRRISETENTSVLCGKAALDILGKATISADKVDLIIVATMSPDYLSPSTACLVQDYIGASKSMAFDVSAACSGFIYALSVAEKMLSSGKFHYALVLGGEVMSKIIDWDDRGTAVLFGDGAGGVLLENTPSQGSFIAEDIHSDGSRGLALTTGALPVSNPYSQNEKNPADIHLKMEGRAIFDFAIRSVPKSIKAVVETAGIDLSDVERILPHQANSRIIQAIAKKLKIPFEQFALNISDYGNTSAASIPILLDELVSSGDLVLGTGKKIILTGFGGGLTWGSILIRI